MSNRLRRSDCWFAFDVSDRRIELNSMRGRDLVACCSIQRNKKCPFYDPVSRKIDGSKCELYRK